MRNGSEPPPDGAESAGSAPSGVPGDPEPHGDSGLDGARVVLITRAGCHLCQEAEAVLHEVCGRRQVSWRSLDVDVDRRRCSKWGDHVPVTFVDGRLLSRWILDRDALVSALGAPDAHLEAPA